MLSAQVDRSGFRFSRLYRGTLDAQILVLGNSRAVAATPPTLIERAIGKKSRSLAFNGINPEIALVLLADYLDRHPAPEVLLVEASFVVNKLTLVTDLKIYLQHSERLRALFEKYQPKLALAARYSRLFGVNCEFLLRALRFRFGSDDNWMNRGRISADKLRALIAAPVERLENEPKHLASLNRIIEVARERNIDVRLFIAPYLPATRNSHGVDAWLVELRAALGNNFVDYSNALDSPKYFADRIHPNEVGAAELINKMIADDFLRAP